MNTTSVPAHVPLRSGTYALLAAGFLAFAVYGSWVPFHSHALPLAEALHQFSAVCARPVRIDSISDWTANVLLFVPIGFTLMAALGVDRRWRNAVLAAPLVVVFCVAASTAIEFSQLFFPDRVSSLNDIVAQTIGTGIGVLGWLGAGQRLTVRLRRTWTSLGTQGLSARLLPAYLVFLLLVHTMPFDLTLSPGQLVHKYREGRVHPWPFEFGSVRLSALLIKQVWNILYFVPLGILLARLHGTTWRDPRRWWRVCVFGLASAAAIQFAKLFVASRNCEAFDVIVDALAVLLGWALSIVRLPGRAPQECLPARPLLAALDRRWLLAGWVGIVLLLSWLPLDFRCNPRWALERLHGLSLIPFADYQQASPYQAFDQALHRLLVFAPLGALLASLHRRGLGRVPTGSRDLPAMRPALVVGLPAVALAIVIEIGQLFLPDRYPSVTDVILEIGGAWAGALLYRHAHRLLPENRLAGEMI